MNEVLQHLGNFLEQMLAWGTFFAIVGGLALCLMARKQTIKEDGAWTWVLLTIPGVILLITVVIGIWMSM